MDERGDTGRGEAGHAAMGGWEPSFFASADASVPGERGGARARPVPQLAAVLDSAQIFRGSNEVQIVHGEAVYRLRRTSLGKLILTK